MHPATRQAPVFAALGDPTRLALLDKLGRGDALSITTLAEGSGVTRQAITKHLDVLAAAGLVHDLRKGRERLYRVEPRAFDALANWIEEYRRGWEQSLDRLDDYLQTLTDQE